MEYIDLHTHSTASDGTLRPAEIFELACSIGLRAVALTDHDTTAGVAEFTDAARERPECEAIPGVELACSYGGKELHIVGLFIDSRSEQLTAFIEKARINRASRNRDIFAKLQILGYKLDIDMPEFRSLPIDQIGRPHFAQALAANYDFPNIRTVFEKLLGHSRPAYVPRRLSNPKEAIDAIHAAGGIAIWAHPVRKDGNECAALRRCCRKLGALGLDGVEGYYSMFSQAETALVTETAKTYSLAVSGGSDFHGANSPNIVLGFGTGGLRVPAELLTALKAKRIR